MFILRFYWSPTTNVISKYKTCLWASNPVCLRVGSLLSFKTTTKRIIKIELPALIHYQCSTPVSSLLFVVVVGEICSDFHQMQAFCCCDCFGFLLENLEPLTLLYDSVK